MMIEAAYQAKQKTVEFEDTKGVMYVIDFDRMLEFPQTKPDDTALVLRQDKLRGLIMVTVFQTGEGKGGGRMARTLARKVTHSCPHVKL